MSLKPFSLGVIKKKKGEYLFQSRRPSCAEVVQCGCGGDVIWTKVRWQRYISFQVLSGVSLNGRYMVLDIFHFQRRSGLLDFSPNFCLEIFYNISLLFI